MSEDTMRCAMTGIVIRDSGDGIWDDGEWISWEYIDRQLAEQEGSEDQNENDQDQYGRPWRREDLIGGCPNDHLDDWDLDNSPSLEEFDPELFQEMVALHLEDQIPEITSSRWGKIGERYLNRHYGVKLSRAHAQGHDGHLGSDLVEIKTISPSKRIPFVRVKRAGNFNVLAVVRVHRDLRIEIRFLRRTKLPPGGSGKYCFVKWETAVLLGEVPVPRR